MPAKITPGAVGDWLEVSCPGRAPSHRGQIVEVLGEEHHERYLVDWTDEHTSIHYPSDGTRIISRPSRVARTASTFAPPRAGATDQNRRSHADR